MILNFEYDKKTKTINRFIKKTFGASCNCALGYDMTFKCYRILFTLQLSKQKKNKQTQITISELNHIFFNGLNGARINDEATIEQIKTYCVQHLNYFPDRRDFLLQLTDIFITKFSMAETAAINAVNEWQDCILTAYESAKDQYTLLLDARSLDGLGENNPLRKLLEGVELLEKGDCKYKEIKLDMETLENLLLLYS